MVLHNVPWQSQYYSSRNVVITVGEGTTLKWVLVPSTGKVEHTVHSFVRIVLSRLNVEPDMTLPTTYNSCSSINVAGITVDQC